MPVVTAEHKGDKLFEVKLEKQTLKVDLPVTSGGKERGPTPTGLCAASLASCIAAVVTMHCDSVKIDTTGLTVSMTYDKLEKPSRLGNFRATIRIPHGQFDEKRKDAILRAAERCPVHETIRLHSGVEFVLEK